MSKKICIIYTETNGLHQCNEDVSKKNLYNFARLVVLNYEIGTYEKKKFKSILKVRTIIKPRCMYISEESSNIHKITMQKATDEGCEIEDTLLKFIEDLSSVSVIVSHNIDFHLKTIIAEMVRYNINFKMSNYTIIDIINFYHKLSYPKLSVLYDHLYSDKKEQNNLEKIKLCFIKLYSNYEKSI